MQRFGEYLALRGFAFTTQQNYYRAIRLIGEFHSADPASLNEEALRLYFVEVKCRKQWAPKSLQAILQCRTYAMGGHRYDCDCGHQHFAYHSCNHGLCPQCGARDNSEWIAKQLEKLLPVPYSDGSKESSSSAASFCTLCHPAFTASAIADFSMPGENPLSSG